MTRKRAGSLLCLALLIWPTFVLSQHSARHQVVDLPDGPSQRQLDTALRFGVIATLGPLCRLRDAAWGEDLWRAELQAMGVRPDPVAPDQQRFADVAGAALSYAEDQALEKFAAGPPGEKCRPMTGNADLEVADQMVKAYRAGIGQPLW